MEVPNVKDNKSTRAILGTAKILFWKFGLKKVSVEELCKEAGVSKMTFYRYFNNKVEVLMVLLKEQMDRSVATYKEIMLRDIVYGEKVKHILDFKRKESQEVSMELVKDIYSNSEELAEVRNYTMAYQQEFMSTLRQDFLSAQKKGYIKQEIKIDFVLYMLNVMEKQLHDSALIGMYDDVIDLQNDLTTMFFYGILGDE